MKKKMKDNDTQEELKEAFKFFDIEGKGLINVKDLRVTMLSLGETLSSEELDRLINEADEDGDGYVNFEEFVRNVFKN
jgi:Ca2+-binding EF-hand superfamily protein